MVQQNGFKILKDCRSYLETFNLCNTTNKRICNIPMPFAVMNLLNVAPFIITVSRLIRFCALGGFQLSEVENGAAILLGVSQLALIYIALAFERSSIIKAIEQMQFIVNERKVSYMRKRSSQQEIKIDVRVEVQNSC